MNILNSRLYKNCFQEKFSDKFLEFRNKSFFITGCNGLICSTLVDLLIFLNEKHNLNLKIYLGTRNLEKTINRFETGNKSYVIPIDYDATKSLLFDKPVDYVIYGASNASPDLFIKQPVETMMGNIYGINEVLKYALKKTCRVLYISSSEVYGIQNNNEPIKENQIGYIDILNPRSSYSMAKRASETLCASYGHQFGVDFVIARPGHIYGSAASETDIRVSTDFMFRAATGKDIILKSKGEQLRSYCYSVDCASALLTILLYGKSGESYNISNKHSIISIAQMAELFASAGSVQVHYDFPEYNEKQAFNPMMNSSLNSDKLESLGWIPLFSREEGFDYSVKILRELYHDKKED